MFNRTYVQGGNTSQSIHINAVTGAILKNHPKSWFEKFNLNSGRASQLFEEGGSRGYEKEYCSNGRDYWWKSNPEKAITVLQMVICGDMEVMAELVYTKDYLEAFDGGADNG